MLLSEDCMDDGICRGLIFNDNLCTLREVRQNCCQSCASECIDNYVCALYPKIKNLCRMSIDIRSRCPSSCGMCKNEDLSKCGLRTAKCLKIIIL